MFHSSPYKYSLTLNIQPSIPKSIRCCFINSFTSYSFYAITIPDPHSPLYSNP
nr:MAG TPA: hypothetical protein [Caudoviricetes sp.]